MASIVVRPAAIPGTPLFRANASFTQGFGGVLFPFQDARRAAAAVEPADGSRSRRADTAAHPLCVAGPQAGRGQCAVACHLRLLAAWQSAALSAGVAISAMG